MDRIQITTISLTDLDKLDSLNFGDIWLPIVREGSYGENGRLGRHLCNKRLDDAESLSQLPGLRLQNQE